MEDKTLIELAKEEAKSRAKSKVPNMLGMIQSGTDISPFKMRRFSGFKNLSYSKSKKR